MDMHEGETIEETFELYGKRLGEQLEARERERRIKEPRYDLERHVVEQVEALGLQVCETAYALKPDVTPNHTVRSLELPSMSGLEIRVVAEHISRGQISYRDLERMRDGAPTWVDHVTKTVVRQLMVAQRAEAQAWLEANPEEAV